MIWSSTADGMITYASPEWEIFTGQPMSEALGTGWISYLHPDDSARTEADFQKALALHAPFTFRYRLKHVDLGYVDVVTAATPSFSPIDGSFIGYIGALTDIDDKHSHAPVSNVIGNSTFISASKMSAPTMPLDIIANYLLLAKATAISTENTRMLPSLDFAISEVMRELKTIDHATVQ